MLRRHGVQRRAEEWTAGVWCSLAGALANARVDEEEEEEEETMLFYLVGRGGSRSRAQEDGRKGGMTARGMVRWSRIRHGEI